MKNETLELAKALLARPSVSPEDGGCQQLIVDRLVPLGFRAETIAGGGVTNLFMEQFPHRPALVGGILAEDCQAVLAEFFEKLRQGKPSTQSF